MEPNETTLISGRIVTEFEDDASQFLAGEAEFVHAVEAPAVTPPAIPLPPVKDVAQRNPG
jgi:hypothetical protein